MPGMGRRFPGKPGKIMKNHPTLLKGLYFSGIGLLVVATLMGVLLSLGWFSFSGFLAGESEVHMVARVAVLGCMLAAVGSLD